MKGAMLKPAACLVLMGLAAEAFGQPGRASHPPLLAFGQAQSIAAELSGSAALRTVTALSLHHRMRGSTGFAAAAELIRERQAEYGLEDVEILSLPADGTIFYGTQRSRPAWNATFAELWEQRREGSGWVDGRRIASWADQPISLAQDSVSGRAEAELIDVGAGTAESDYAGKEVRGRLVLTSSQPEAVADLAVGRFGAAGIVSWAQNQRTAWWGEDESLVRWGHLNTFGAHPTFAFMVSPAQARAWQERLRGGETVRLRAEVEAGRSAGAYLIPTAIIPGERRDEEIVYSCHLDHPSPGANDNASGCAGILEIARSLNRLVESGALPRPQRTLRFIWPCEIECTIALLNARPEFARNTLATIHLDMIGGDTGVTQSILRVRGSPPSLPSFVSEIGFTLADYVNRQSLAFADTGEAAQPLLDPQGSRRPLQAIIGGFEEGSDHQIWSEGSWRIPVIYIADWPDRYIHTQRDVPGNLDPTKMRRAMFIAAASGWFLANISETDRDALRRAVRVGSDRIAATAAERARILAAGGAEPGELEGVLHEAEERRDELALSLERFFNPNHESSIWRVSLQGPSAPVYRRTRRDGPMNGFGYSWLDDELARRRWARPRLLAREPEWDGPSFGYEALNLVDGARSVGEIQGALAATVGRAPVEEVAEYLETLARLGVVEAVER